jgi:hypothetical protein
MSCGDGFLTTDRVSNDIQGQEPRRPWPSLPSDSTQYYESTGRLPHRADRPQRAVGVPPASAVAPGLISSREPWNRSRES